MINESKLREKLKWIIHPFRNSGLVPEGLADKIVDAVKECEEEQAVEEVEEN